MNRTKLKSPESGLFFQDPDFLYVQQLNQSVSRFRYEYSGQIQLSFSFTVTEMPFGMQVRVASSPLISLAFFNADSRSGA